MAQMPMYKGRKLVVGFSKSHYHLTTIPFPIPRTHHLKGLQGKKMGLFRQRLFFERFAFGYSRSVVWLEPFSCLAIAERLKGCHFTPRRTALIPNSSNWLPLRKASSSSIGGIEDLNENE